MIHVISEINSRLHKSDWSTQKTDSRKEVAYAPDDQEVSIVKVTLHAWYTDTCEEEGATHGVRSLFSRLLHFSLWKNEFH